jgi:hypothetical protein
MNDFNEHRLPDDLQHVAKRLRDQRPEATALELDRIKLRAMTRVKDARAPTLGGKGRFMRSKLVGAMLAVGMLAGGTGAMAITGTGPSILEVTSTSSPTSSQYCPDKSPGGGTPKFHPGTRCGTGPKP